MLLLDSSEESLSIIKKTENVELKKIKIIDYSINKFSNYCLRVLIKKGKYDYKKTPPYYHFVKSLEEIGDQYKELCVFHSENLKKVDERLIELFNKTNKYLEEIYNLFYKHDESKIEELFDKTKITFKELSKIEDRLGFYLSSICRDIRNLLPLLIEINM